MITSMNMIALYSCVSSSTGLDVVGGCGVVLCNGVRSNRGVVHIDGEVMLSGVRGGCNACGGLARGVSNGLIGAL